MSSNKRNTAQAAFVRKDHDLSFWKYDISRNVVERLENCDKTKISTNVGLLCRWKAWNYNHQSVHNDSDRQASDLRLSLAPERRSARRSAEQDAPCLEAALLKKRL